MKFLEIQEGVSVNIDKIVMVKKESDLTSNIITTNGTFLANFPYMTLLRIIEIDMQESKGRMPQETIDKLDAVLSKADNFAG